MHCVSYLVTEADNIGSCANMHNSLNRHRVTKPHVHATEAAHRQVMPCAAELNLRPSGRFNSTEVDAMSSKESFNNTVVVYMNIVTQTDIGLVLCLLLLQITICPMNCLMQFHHSKLPTKLSSACK